MTATERSTPRWILRLQGLYYLATGLHPLIHYPSFEAVTGPKIDDWLVKMVGLLAATIGLTLLAGSRPGRPTGELLLLSVGSALSFLAIDLYYSLAGRISRIYLADAVLQLFILVFLFALVRRGRKTAT